MSKILLIEPYKILRQAISLSLFPEHEVWAEENIDTAVASLKEYDLLIVDGAALREGGRLTPEVTRAIQASKIPVLWLEEEEGSKLPKNEKLVVVKKPIEKDTFQSALAALLSAPTAPKEEEEVTSPPASGAGGDAAQRPPRRRRTQGPQQVTFQFIDLVDVVEQQPDTKPGKKAPRKSK